MSFSYYLTTHAFFSLDNLISLLNTKNISKAQAYTHMFIDKLDSIIALGVFNSEVYNYFEKNRISKKIGRSIRRTFSDEPLYWNEWFDSQGRFIGSNKETYKKHKGEISL